MNNKKVSQLYPYRARLSFFMVLPLLLISSIVVLSKLDLYIKAKVIAGVILLLLRFFYFRIQITEGGIILSRLVYRNKIIDWKDVSKLVVSVPSNPVIPIQMKVICGAKRTMIESKNQETITRITACFLEKGIDVTAQDKPLAQEIVENARGKI